MYIKVKLHAKSNKEKIVRISEDKFEIWIKEKAENNLANKRLLEILPNQFKEKIKRIQIINGHHKPSKLLKITFK
ncbi:MAG: DUF167 domain-containing protein [Candidatus Pacebacteria bacterium]|nr:DUF167 domain-containing protein [Candidatus Paceibacterota bacterium]